VINVRDRAEINDVREQEIARTALTVTVPPRRVWFALTGRCNLACLHCPRIAGVSSDEDMTQELFSRVIAEVIRGAEEVNFGGNNLGEQMLHPAFYDAVDAIKKAGCEVLLTTNGTKLNATSAEQLASHGVRLRISIEGVGAVYHQVRKVSWDRLLEGLRAYQRSSQAHPEAGASLEFALTVFADNIHQLPELVRTASELGADRLFAHHLLPKNDDQKLQSLFFHRKAANEAFAEATAIGKQLGLAVAVPSPLDCGSLSPVPLATKPKETEGLAPCYLPWTSVNVLENGDVLPCCVADSSLTMGSLKRNSFHEIWNGPAYRKLRRTVNSKKPLRACATCSMRGGATQGTYDSLLNKYSVVAMVKSGVKKYLLKTKRRKMLTNMIRMRDGFNRVRARF
jgi:radical SAM protein with 4Fe4S-binding SPASM domain